jgi:hypothetical protein
MPETAAAPMRVFEKSLALLALARRFAPTIVLLALNIFR